MAHSEIQAIKESWLKIPFGDTLPEWRKAFDGLGDMFQPAGDAAFASVDAGGVPGEWCQTPGCDQRRAVLFLHGGGYCMGSLRSHRHLASEISRAARASVLSIDYRLAPEAPFPAAVDDALAAYRLLLARGIAAGSISIAGDSAGGGLAVALLIAIRDAGLPQPASAVCISPWLDLELTGSSMATKAAEDQMAPRPMLQFLRDTYLAGQDVRHPLASPIHADLKGIAPLLLMVGSAEVLIDDAVRLAGAAGAAEVPVRLEIWPEMVHVWPLFHPMLGEGRRAIARIGDFIREHDGAGVRPAAMVRA